MARNIVMKQIREHAGVPINRIQEAKLAFSKGGMISVVGPHGAGKTGIVNKALDEMIEEDQSICVMRTSGLFSIDYNQTVEALYYQYEQYVESSQATKPKFGRNTSSNTWDEFQKRAQELIYSGDKWIIVIEEFDAFTTKRQNLLYHLFEVVNANQNISLIAVTSNLNFMDNLEKRVRSRFAQSPIFVEYAEIATILLVLERWLILPEESKSMFKRGYVEKWNSKCQEIFQQDEFNSLITRFTSRTKNFFNLSRLVELSLVFKKGDFLTLADFQSSNEMLSVDSLVEMGKGINLASLLMLISMSILTQREIEKINFEYVYSEYEKYISGLGSHDDSMELNNYSKPICQKAFQSLHTVGLINSTSYNSKRPFASQLMTLAITSSQVSQILKQHRCPSWIDAWVKSV